MNTTPSNKFDVEQNFNYDELASRFQHLQQQYSQLISQKDLNKISRDAFEKLLFEYHQKQLYIIDLISKYEPTNVKNQALNKYGKPSVEEKIILYKDWLIKVDTQFTVAYSQDETLHCFRSNTGKLLIEKETFLTWAFLKYKFAYRNMEEKNQVLDVNGLHIQFAKMIDREYVKNFSITNQTFELNEKLL
jgi:hypothetical protein